MTTVLVVFAMITLLFGLSAWAAAYARRQTWARPLALTVFVVMSPLLMLGALESMGWNKPTWAAWDMGGDFLVLGSKIIEGEAIYLYVDLQDGGEPRALQLPWDENTAKELRELLMDPENNGMAIMRYEWSWDSSGAQFHPMPQPLFMPPKDAPDEPATLEREA